MRKHINLKETDQKNEETHKKYWEIPRKYLNKRKGKRIYNSGKSIKKKRKLLKISEKFEEIAETSQKYLLLSGFPVFLIQFRVESFRCWGVSMSPLTHLTESRVHQIKFKSQKIKFYGDYYLRNSGLPPSSDLVKILRCDRNDIFPHFYFYTHLVWNKNSIFLVFENFAYIFAYLNLRW